MAEDETCAAPIQPFFGGQGGKLSVNRVSSAVTMSDVGASEDAAKSEGPDENRAPGGTSNLRFAEEKVPGESSNQRTVGFAEETAVAGWRTGCVTFAGSDTSTDHPRDVGNGAVGSRGRSVGFAEKFVEHEIENTTTSGVLNTRKSHFSRFLKGDASQAGDSVSPRKAKAARKTLTDLMPKRKSTAFIRLGSSPKDTIITRKTLGNVGLETENDLALDQEDMVEVEALSANVSTNNGTRFPRAPSRVLQRGKDMNRSRSMSRGPRRGRDRFRGVGAMFSTSKARNAPRPPRQYGVENVPAGMKSSKGLSILRGKRSKSPDPRVQTEEELKAELLKCHSVETPPPDKSPL